MFIPTHTYSSEVRWCNYRTALRQFLNECVKSARDGRHMRHNNGKSVAVALLGPLDIAQLQIQVDWVTGI